MAVRRMSFALLLGLALVCGCSDDEATEAGADAPELITVTSAAFRDGQRVPARFTCDGEEVSPPLEWSGVPKAAKALALVVDDPDAPGGIFVHWVALDIPVDVGSVSTDAVPRGAVEIANSAGDPSYAGPCPPSGTHHYRFTVYALSEPTGLDRGVGREEALAEVDDLTIGRGTLVGTYQRSGS
jgi:Raf kinase inhibitor-like YbhB/YbcL family protein